MCIKSFEKHILYSTHIEWWSERETHKLPIACTSANETRTYVGINI